MSSLSLPEERMRELGYRVVDLVVDHFARLADEPAARRGSRSDLEAALSEPIPELRTDPDLVLDRVVRDVLPWTARGGPSRFFAFVPSSQQLRRLRPTRSSGFNVFAGTWLGASGRRRWSW
jgi:hypothetical protein